MGILSETWYNSTEESNDGDRIFYMSKTNCIPNIKLKQSKRKVPVK